MGLHILYCTQAYIHCVCTVHYTHRVGLVSFFSLVACFGKEDAGDAFPHPPPRRLVALVWDAGVEFLKEGKQEGIRKKE